jgi:hypothetical protein
MGEAKWAKGIFGWHFITGESGLNWNGLVTSEGICWNVVKLTVVRHAGPWEDIIDQQCPAIALLTSSHIFNWQELDVPMRLASAAVFTGIEEGK